MFTDHSSSLDDFKNSPKEKRKHTSTAELSSLLNSLGGLTGIQTVPTTQELEYSGVWSYTDPGFADNLTALDPFIEVNPC